MKERKPEILYSDPVKEIMGNPPRKIIRWGTTVLFSIFFLFIVFAWIIRYPDVIPAPVEITTLNPPVTLDARITGRIKYLYVKDRDTVKAGQIIAVMETTASIDEIKSLKKAVDTIRNPESLTPGLIPEFSALGELQGYYATFMKNLSDLNNYNINDFWGSKIAYLTQEIDGIQDYIRRLINKESLYSENQKLEARKYGRDSSLYSDNALALADLERSRQALLRINIELQQVRLDRSAKSIELSEKRQDLQDYRNNRVLDKEKLISILGESFLNLKAQLSIWENNYLLISQIDGVASFTKFWSANQSVIKDEPVINIVPLETGNFIGRVTLNMQRSGKVKPGQQVNIKLSGYPYLEFGIVRGVVKSISLVPSGDAGDAYIIEIGLPDGLSTLYGMNLNFTQNMKGTAEIITDDIRLLQKIINPFRYLILHNRR